ncbi:hypothetical protein CPL00188L_CDS0026 [Escherichia phage WaterSpirit]
MNIKVVIFLFSRSRIYSALYIHMQYPVSICNYINQYTHQTCYTPQPNETQRTNKNKYRYIDK